MAGSPNRPRIVSLLPACTEVVCELGLEDCLVGRSHECDFPESIQSLPVCTGTVIDSSQSSEEIDRQVKRRLEQGLSLYSVQIETLRKLQPDFILTQTQCKVCGMHLDELQKTLQTEQNIRARILDWNPNRLADLWTEMRRVATELGIEEDEGMRRIRELKGRLVAIIEKVCLANPRPSVVCLEWLNPLMVSGNWVPDMIDIGGGINLRGKAGQHSHAIEWNTVVEANPDVLMILPCGFDLLRTRKEALPLRDLPGWKTLKAVKKNRVILVDGNQYFNRPGPRLVDSFEILAEVLHPRLIEPRYEGTGWERL